MFKLNFTQRPLPKEETGSALLGRQQVAYVIQRKAGRRNIALYFSAQGKLRFLAPARVKTSTIEDILRQKSEWIAEKLGAIQQRAAFTLPQEFTDGEITYFLGLPYRLHIVANRREQGCTIVGNEIQICLPDSSPAELTHDARLEMLLWYKKQAKAILPERLEHWREKLGVQYKSVKITNPKSQWGSCSARNDIRLNWRVIVAPMEAIDYLVAHELCHIVHKNHSRRFWNLLASVMPDHKARRKILRNIDSGFEI